MVKKILYLSTVGVPSEWAHGIQIMKMCDAFTAFGYDVTLVVPKRRIEIKQDPFKYYDIKHRFRITKLPCLDICPGSPSRLTFLLRTVTFLVAAKLYVVGKRFNLVYTRLSLAGFFFRHSILELHSIPEQPSRFLIRLWRRLTHIIVLNQFIKDTLIQHRIKNKNILIAADGVDTEQFALKVTAKEARERLHLPLDKRIIM